MAIPEKKNKKVRGVEDIAFLKTLLEVLVFFISPMEIPGKTRLHLKKLHK